MPTKKPISLLLIAFLLVSAGAIVFQNGRNDFVVKAEAPGANTIVDGDTNANLTIQSPTNKTYSETNVTLTFTLESDVVPIANFTNMIFDLFYYHGCVLDYNPSKLGSVAGIVKSHRSDVGNFPNNVATVLSASGNRYVFNATLTNLSQGSHNVTVWIMAEQFLWSWDMYSWSIVQTVKFDVDSIPPNVTVLSPENKAYNVTDVPLNFTVNEVASQISYSLDGHVNITANGNMTLTRLSAGEHNVTVYAVDAGGNIGASNAIPFTVALPEPFPVVLFVVAVVIVAVLSAGLLLYFKKHRR